MGGRDRQAGIEGRALAILLLVVLAASCDDQGISGGDASTGRWADTTVEEDADGDTVLETRPAFFIVPPIGGGLDEVECP